MNYDVMENIIYKNFNMWEVIGLGMIFGLFLFFMYYVLEDLGHIRLLLTRNNELTDKTNRRLKDIESLIRINQ